MADLFEINSPAPAFSLPDSQGKIISNEDYLGKWLILYFYPKDDTPGCSLEANDFSRLVGDFKDLGVEIVGVSKDSTQSHCNFIEKHKLKINLLSDLDLQVIKSYKAWGIKKNYGKEYEGLIRSTFLINPQGKLTKYWSNVRAKGHADRVLKEVKKLLDK